MLALHDKLFIDENGTIYTGEYLNHNEWIKNNRTTKEYIREYNKSITIRCNYDQLFYDNSSLVLCNDIISRFPEMWECIENGEIYYEDEDGNEEDIEIYQWYIIDDETARFLKDFTNEIIFYCESLNIYVLGVTHFGTSWGYVGAGITTKAI